MGIEEDMARDDWSPLEAVRAESPVLFQELSAALSGKRSALAKELDAGVPPDAFKRGRALLAAHDAAIAGLEKARRHRSV